MCTAANNVRHLLTRVIKAGRTLDFKILSSVFLLSAFIYIVNVYEKEHLNDVTRTILSYSYSFYVIKESTCVVTCKFNFKLICKELSYSRTRSR